MIITTHRLQRRSHLRSLWNDSVQCADLDFVDTAGSLSYQGYTVLVRYSRNIKLALQERGISYEYIVPDADILKRNYLYRRPNEDKMRDDWFYEIVNAYRETESAYFLDAIDMYHSWDGDIRDIRSDSAIKIYTNSIHPGSWVHKVKEENSHIYPCTKNTCYMETLCEDDVNEEE